MALELTDQNFKETVLDSDKVALVDFWAEWCGPCRMIEPMVKLTDEYQIVLVRSTLTIIGNGNNLWYSIYSIILFLKRGEIVLGLGQLWCSFVEKLKHTFKTINLD